MIKDEKAPASSKGHKRRTGVADKPADTRVPDLAPSTRVALHEVGAKADAPKPAGAKEPNTIIYIHGIGNKPTASVLKCQWDTALFSKPLGDRSRMAYWVNPAYYPRPLDETCASGDLVRIDDEKTSTRAIMAVAADTRGDEELALSNEIKALTA
ncbi:MAG: hypothetical protein ACT4O2_01500, partial [Beijerinckiaceae bacterium]